MTPSNGDRPQPPPIAGAFDLGALKQSQHDKDAIAQAQVQMLQQQGLVCPCGERVRDQGVEFWALITQTAEGASTVAVGSTTYCNCECPELKKAIASTQGPAARAHGTRGVCLRDAPVTEWLDEPVAD